MGDVSRPTHVDNGTPGQLQYSAEASYDLQSLLLSWVLYCALAFQSAILWLKFLKI